MTNPDKTPYYEVLGVPIDALRMDEAAKIIVERATDTKKPPVYVSKPYVEYFDLITRDPKVRELINKAWLLLPDAVSIQWATTYLYGGVHTFWRMVSLTLQIIFRPSALRHYIPEKFGGATFTWELLNEAEHKGASVYLFGSPQQTSIEATADVIRKHLPRLEIAGTHAGALQGLSSDELRRALKSQPVENELVADLKKTNPDIILVGMGFPLQEELMAKIAPQLSHGVLIGEGGTFDYDSFGGVRKRAPHWMQRIGLEWLWRLILEPKRIGRQLAIPRFIWKVYRSG
jgi:N-acetylglucosaminyldiphosphoundecaprenol N-acetyl-beta-D-mannosaminyltransferase